MQIRLHTVPEAFSLACSESRKMDLSRGCSDNPASSARQYLHYNKVKIRLVKGVSLNFHMKLDCKMKQKMRFEHAIYKNSIS